MLLLYYHDLVFFLHVKVHKDCQEAFDRGFTDPGMYLVSPDGVRKGKVYCDPGLNDGGLMVGRL